MLASALFVVACAVFAITFVAARGGLQMPIAAIRVRRRQVRGVRCPVAAGAAAAATSPPPAPRRPSIEPAPTPRRRPATDARPRRHAAGPPDPLTALPACPDLPGCYEYRIQRGDSLSGVASRYVIPVSSCWRSTRSSTDPSTIVVGEMLYLGRDPFLRLAAVPGRARLLAVHVRPGDRLSTIAGRFGLTLGRSWRQPDHHRPNAIYSGQVIRLPHPAP